MNTNIADIATAAKMRFANTPFAHNKDEYWRFANLSAWNADGLFPYFTNSKPPAGEPCAAVRGAEAKAASAQIALFDGQITALSKIGGVEILPMAEAFADYGDRLSKFFGGASGKLDLFQASRPDRGVFVRVREGVSAELEMSLIAKLHASAAGAFFVLEKNSSLTLLKTSLVFGGSLGVARFGFDIGENARLNYAQIKLSEAASLMFEREDFYMASGCEVVDAMAQEGLANSRSERNFNLYGTHCALDSRVFLKTSGDITADLRTKQTHFDESSKSNLEVKAALDDSSRIAFTGLVDVCSKAQKTEAYQSCRSLLLSKNAVSQASPILEISANDVMCSHGCTVAEPDKEELFYMQQRGLTDALAREMIVESFAGTTFEKIPQSEKLRHFLRF